MRGCKSLKNTGYFSDTGLLCDEANSFTPRSFPFHFSGPRLSLNLCWRCIPQHNGVQMAPCAAGVWLSLCLFCSNQPFGDGERFIPLSITLLWKKKAKKTPIGIISWHICTHPFCQGMCCASTVNCWKCKVAVKHDVLVFTKNHQPFAFNRRSVA